MKIVSKSNDIYIVENVKEGVTSKNEPWAIAHLVGSDGHVNLFVQKFAIDKVKESIGKKGYLVTEYLENYNKKTEKSYTSYTVKDFLTI